MKKYLAAIILITITSTSFSCSTPALDGASSEIATQDGNIAKNISPKEFAEAIKSKKNAVLLDVRTPKEIAKGHLTDALFIDFYEESFKAELEKLDKTKPILVYCHSGGRSGKTMKTLTDMGFKEVYNLETGIVGWKEAGLPTVK